MKTQLYGFFHRNPDVHILSYLIQNNLVTDVIIGNNKTTIKSSAYPKGPPYSHHQIQSKFSNHINKINQVLAKEKIPSQHHINPMTFLSSAFYQISRNHNDFAQQLKYENPKLYRKIIRQ